MSRESQPSREPATDPMIGQLTLGRYRVVKPLAHGGMGVVYLGRTEGAAGFARPVVIKRVLPELLTDPNIGQMFVREARILSHLHHTGIVGVVDFGHEDSAYVMVLDYVHGYDANQWLNYLRRKGRNVPIDVALQIVIRILEALHYAHTLTRADGTSTQVVHRDISPSNILLDAEGNVRLLDFGIARIANAANVYQTQETTFKGKLGYAHPSLIARGEPSAQTDVYSAAVVLFQLLIGQNPFRGANPAETLQKVIRGPLPRLRASLPTAPESLELVLLRAMSRNLSEGFASAAELAEELRAIRVGTETSVNAEMSRTFRADFHGDMAVLLDLEPLEQRDAAWRSMAHAHAPGALKSTPPRAPDSEEPTRIRRTNSDEPTRAAPSIPPEKSVTGRTSLPSLARRNPWPWVGVSVALTLGIAWTVTTAMHDTSDLRPLNDPLPASLTPVAIALPEPTRAPEPPASVKTVATVNTAEPVIKAPIRPDLGLLTRRFTEQSTDIQRCFKEHPQATAAATLQLSLSVSQSGLVTAANLIPVALEKSAFGQCALAIARTARFDAMTDAVTFRVPLTRAAD